MSEIIKQQDTRRTFIDTLIELAEKDDKVVLVLCDTGFNYVEDFKKRFPDRIFNFGITEQSTVMICVGLALSGFKPYFYSMIPFVLFRPGEMVRNGIVNHHANVKVLGVKGGPSYKMLGFSHNLLHDKEDFNFCDNISLKHHNLQTNEEVKSAVLESYKDGTACYIRL
ncbi:MAG: hypothetical protein AABY15_04045 [Nanoarchaeota archaeon]